MIHFPDDDAKRNIPNIPVRTRAAVSDKKKGKGHLEVFLWLFTLCGIGNFGNVLCEKHISSIELHNSPW